MHTETLNFRLASLRDLYEVYALYMDKESNPFLTYDPMPKEDFKTIFEELLLTETLYVAELNNEVVGTYRLIRKTYRQADTIYIGGFAVKPSHKGKGLGRQMLQHIKQQAISKGIKRIELTVDIDNEAAISLYKKLGFENEGYIRKSYKLQSTGEYYDEYLMALIL
jgi:RimJ/RimL family protein N-acetyltransferase